MTKRGQHKLIWTLVWLGITALNLAAAITDPLIWDGFNVSAFLAGLSLGVAGATLVAE